MRLVVIELEDDDLKQEIIVKNRNVNCQVIRPHLLRFANPSGSLFIQIQDANGQPIKDSNTVAISTLFDTDNLTHFHGYIQFDIDFHFKKETIYNISLRSTGGYTFAEPNYIAWCNDWEHRKYNAAYTPNGDTAGALDLEIWSKDDQVKGDV